MVPEQIEENYPPRQNEKSGAGFILYTNAVYDAVIIPNIGTEFNLGKGWGLNIRYDGIWNPINDRHIYWRIYGGEVTLRKYMGARNAIVSGLFGPHTGHHIGLMAQAITYDIEFKNTGYMAGEPEGNIFNRSSFGVGLEYGYTMPLGRHWNLDFSIGAGWFGGKYYTYEPMGGQYVWQSTARNSWLGPTRADISFYYLFGRSARQKGGGR